MIGTCRRPTSPSSTATIVQKCDDDVEQKGRLFTFDDVKYRFSDIIEQWRVGVIEFAYATVTKCVHPPKNQEFDFIAETVLNVDVALLLEKSA